MQKKSLQRLFLVGFAIVLFISLVGFVAADTTSAPASSDPIIGPLKNFFAEWTKGNFDLGYAKVFLTILVAMIIYGVLDYSFLKGQEKSGLRLIISVIVAFLGMAYLTPQEIYLSLTSYTALGFILSSVIPFVILLFLSVQVHKDGGVGGRIFTRIIWVGFIVFLLFRLYEVTYVPQGGITVPTGMAWGYVLFLLGAIVWMFFGEKQFVKWVFKEELITAKEDLERKIRLQTAKRNLEARSMEEEAGSGI